jgi:hypothetical protein
MYQFFELHHRVTLQPLSDSDFYVDSRYHTRVSFLRDSSGKVTGALINPRRWQQIGIRELAAAAEPDLPAAGEDPEVTKRFIQLLNGLLDGRIDPSQLSPELRAKVSPEQLQGFAAKFKAFGKPAKIVFKKQSNSENENIYVYRVDFSEEHLSFVLRLTRNQT